MSEKPASPGGSRYWLAGIAVTFGVLIGLSAFTFVYAEGFSYFSNDPNACMNCHIMRDQFDGWSHSTHKTVAVCNDCHTPHRFPDKWIVKGINGFNHSLAFTLGTYPENLHIRGFNADIARENCLECHATAVSAIEHAGESADGLNCVACHGNVGHGNVAHGP